MHRGIRGVAAHATPSGAPAASPPLASAEPPATPLPTIPGELARFELEGAIASGRHGGSKPVAGTEYGVKAACVGPGDVTFTVSGAGAVRIAEFSLPCDGVATLNGLGDLPPSSAIQVDAADTENVSRAWAVVAPLDALR